MKNQLFIIFAFFLTISCTNTPAPEGGVIATNGWTAAYAMAAGLDNISILAPYEMAHPSEYEMRPVDIARIEKAELIIYAGYEVMIPQIKSGLALPEEKMLAINTSYNYNEIEQSVMLIAKNRETEEIAKKNLEEIKRSFEHAKNVIRINGMDTIPALVHFFQKSFVNETGIRSSAVFGPAPPEPKQILSLSKTNAALIIDNAHNPVGIPLREIMQNADYVELLNFPGLYQTRTLADVIRFNTEQLIPLFSAGE